MEISEEIGFVKRWFGVVGDRVSSSGAHRSALALIAGTLQRLLVEHVLSESGTDPFQVGHVVGKHLD